MRRLAILLAALTLLAAGCGDDGSILDPTLPTSATTGDTGTTAPPVTEAPATTGAPATTEVPPETTTPPPPTTTTTLPPTTTTTSPPPVYDIDPSDLFPAPLPGSGGAPGSGCVVPGGSTTLTPGVWFGFATTYSGGRIGFDLACFFTGELGWEKAEEDGEEGYDLDFYIRNNNPAIRQVTLDPGARVFALDSGGGGAEPVEITAADWPLGAGYVPCPGEYCAVWLYVNGGVATGLVEQYLP